MDQEAKILLSVADDLFGKAQEELYKPEEDVVPFSVCQNSYYAITNYLNSFLASEGKSLPSSATLDELIKSCISLDTNFEHLHLVPIYNPENNKDLWMSVETAKKFLYAANRTRDMVIQKKSSKV